DLLTKPGASLVIIGPNQPGPVQLLVYGINAALKNIGQTLVVRQLPQNPRTIDISRLASDISDGRIKQLFILGGDPVYNAQSGLSEIDLLNALLGGPKTEGPELVQETFRGTHPPGDFESAWSRFLHDGFASHVRPRDQTSAFNASALGATQSSWALPPPPTAES